MKQDVQSILEWRSRRPVRRQQTTAAIAAFLIHALAVTAAFALPRLTQEERELPEYVEVHVLPASALGVESPRPQPPRPEPPPPEPEPVQPEPEPEPVPEAPDPEIPVLPREEPEPAPRPAPPPQPPPPRPAPTPEPTRPAPAEPPSGRSGPQGSPSGSASGDSALSAQVSGPSGSAFTYDYYLDQMLGRIRQSWVRPPVEGIETLLAFRVLRNGEIADVEIRESSGSRAFDLAALRAVRNASPLPPLPASYREDILKVNLIVR